MDNSAKYFHQVYGRVFQLTCVLHLEGVTWNQFSFRPRAAPELYGSPELGVRGLLYWRLSGAYKKKCYIWNQSVVPFLRSWNLSWYLQGKASPWNFANYYMQSWCGCQARYDFINNLFSYHFKCKRHWIHSSCWGSIFCVYNATPSQLRFQMFKNDGVSRFSNPK